MASTSGAGSSKGMLVKKYMEMGFKEDIVYKAIQANIGKDDSDILETILSYNTMEAGFPDDLPSSQELPDDIEIDESYCYLTSSDSDDYNEYVTSDDEMEEMEEDPVCLLVKMGYDESVASIAVEKCDTGAHISVLIDFICAHQLSVEQDAYMSDQIIKERVKREKKKLKKRKPYAAMQTKKKMKGKEIVEDSIRLPKPMVGFGLPWDQGRVTRRTLPREAKNPPYFYYENVALATRGAWDTISRHLYGIEPEFVDSKYFCAAARKRGYIHNFPLKGRILNQLKPLTIHGALPDTKHWWPKWDTRTNLNCLQTSIGSGRVMASISKALEGYTDRDPALPVQKYVLEQCRKLNFVWVGKNKVAALEPHEVEELLGFPINHTRGGTSKTARYKCLGNSFQVDTVAYHLSVLKPLFPNGMNVLSLFTGIGGAEVALHSLGIRLNNVVSLEKSKTSQNIVTSWWWDTNQRGTLIHLDDVQALNKEKLESLMDEIGGGFDLVIGGSPCNNLAGSNRVSRVGLEGEESSLFYDYVRILEDVQDLMRNNSNYHPTS